MTGRYKKMKKGKSWVIILVAVICIGLLGWYSTAVITDTKQKQEATANGESTKDKDYQNIKLGLDLSGGVSITYHIKDKNPSDKDVNDTIAKLEERAESYTTEYSVYKSGDEFAAIIFVNTRRLKRVQQEFDDVVGGWSGQHVKSISISCGYVSSNEKDWESFDEIVKAADERMYENKAAYYRQEGVDRRYR